MEQIAKKLTQYFLAHGLIKEDDAEVCQYALYRHISRAVGLIALTLLGGLITDFGSAFCFTVSFLFLRERTGGYHAKTEWQCALYSAAMIFFNDVRFADFCGGAQQLLGNYDCLLCPDMGFVTCR